MLIYRMKKLVKIDIFDQHMNKVGLVVLHVFTYFRICITSTVSPIFINEILNENTNIERN